MMQKCEWCNKQNNELKVIAVLSTNLFASKRREISYFVCPEHEPKLRKFYDRSRRYGILFIILSTILTLSLVMSAFWLGSNNYLLGYLFIGSFASLGLVAYIFPFCSPTTFDFMSIATSIRLTRIIGGVIFSLGTILLVLALLYG